MVGKAKEKKGGKGKKKTATGGDTAGNPAKKERNPTIELLTSFNHRGTLTPHDWGLVGGKGGGKEGGGKKKKKKTQIKKS